MPEDRIGGPAPLRLRKLIDLVKKLISGYSCSLDGGARSDGNEVVKGSLEVRFVLSRVLIKHLVLPLTFQFLMGCSLRSL